MIDELLKSENLGHQFGGQRARVRCFLHILNLVAKSLIRQFDVRADKERAKSDAVEQQLAALAEELEGYDERVVAEQEGGSGLGEGNFAEEDDADNEVDAMVEMSPEELAKFE